MPAQLVPTRPAAGSAWATPAEASSPAKDMAAIEAPATVFLVLSFSFIGSASCWGKGVMDGVPVRVRGMRDGDAVHGFWCQA